jgi:hypothetical protein
MNPGDLITIGEGVAIHVVKRLAPPYVFTECNRSCLRIRASCLGTPADLEPNLSIFLCDQCVSVGRSRKR